MCACFGLFSRALPEAEKAREKRRSGRNSAAQHSRISGTARGGDAEDAGCSNHLTRTKIPLKSTISEGFFLFFVYCGANGEMDTHTLRETSCIVQHSNRFSIHLYKYNSVEFVVEWEYNIY